MNISQNSYKCTSSWFICFILPSRYSNSLLRSSRICISALASLDAFPVVCSFFKIYAYVSSLKGLYDKNLPHSVFLWTNNFSSYKLGHWLLKLDDAFYIVLVDTNSGDMSLIMFLWLLNVGTFSSNAATIFFTYSRFTCLWILLNVSMASFVLNMGVS